MPFCFVGAPLTSLVDRRALPVTPLAARAADDEGGEDADDAVVEGEVPVDGDGGTGEGTSAAPTRVARYVRAPTSCVFRCEWVTLIQLDMLVSALRCEFALPHLHASFPHVRVLEPQGTQDARHPSRREWHLLPWLGA